MAKHKAVTGQRVPREKMCAWWGGTAKKEKKEGAEEICIGGTGAGKRGLSPGMLS